MAALLRAMKAPLRYALVGATGIGGYHLDVIRTLEKEGLARFAAVADPALRSLPDLQSSLTGQGAACYLDYREMMRGEPEIDVFVISVPIPFHLEMTLACLEREAFIYLEKPPVPLIQQLNALIAKPGSERVGVGFQMVNSRWAQTMKRAIVDGRLGQLREIRIGACWPRLDPYYARNASAGKMWLGPSPIFDGPATNALAHLIHNAMYMAGERMEDFGIPFEITGELYRARPIESYDVACLRGQFHSGVEFTAAVTHATEQMAPYTFHVRGSEGWACVSQDGSLFESSFPCEENGPDTFEQLLEKTHRQFAAFATGEQPRPATSLQDCRGYVLSTNGMLLSSGGIHAIGLSDCCRYGSDSEGGYNVTGLSEAVAASREHGKLFSELGLPWAVGARRVSVENLSSVTLPLEASAG